MRLFMFLISISQFFIELNSLNDDFKVIKILRNTIYVEKNGVKQMYRLVSNESNENVPHGSVTKSARKPAQKKNTKVATEAENIASSLQGVSVKVENWSLERIAHEQRQLKRNGKVRDIKNGIKTLSSKFLS